ncbi:MAG: NUDIX domain-containing protein, partial [Gammaproteobacteria bacterium]|nr:NUDIX domain-containing protein [Gammaproteobacteria bacterium]
MQTENPIIRVSDIDWQNWQPEQTATLLFVIVDGEILLIRKKRGLGAGKINGPGGRLEAGETPIECAIRETREELCITPLGVRPMGRLHFYASDDIPHILGYVFTATGFTGQPR